MIVSGCMRVYICVNFLLDLMEILFYCNVYWDLNLRDSARKVYVLGLSQKKSGRITQQSNVIIITD